MAKGSGFFKSSGGKFLVFGALAVGLLFLYAYFRQKSGIMSRWSLAGRFCDEKTPCSSGYDCKDTICVPKPATLGLSIVYSIGFFVALYLLARYFL
jgi:hypothetical protein